MSDEQRTPIPTSFGAPLERVLETEVMDTHEEARDYDAMDHSEVNARFCEDLLRTLGARARESFRVLDVGTGTARIPIELCTRAKAANVVALDLAEHMLAVGRENVKRANYTDRIELRLVDAKKMGESKGAFDVVMSNSIVHHIPDPRDVIREAWRLTKAGGLLFVRDLARPRDVTHLDELVAKYAGAPADDSPKARASFEHQRTLFRDSLHAALTPAEVREIVMSMDIDPNDVRMTSDRHWTLSAIRGAS